MLYVNGTPTQAGARRAVEAAEKALTIGPERAEGHQALGDYYRLVVKDSARALPELERARRLSPGSAAYVSSLALIWEHRGQWEAALGALEEAQRDLLVRLTPSAFDEDRGLWALCLTQAYALKPDEPNVRKYAELARAAFEGQLKAVPEDAQSLQWELPGG